MWLRYAAGALSQILLALGVTGCVVFLLGLLQIAEKQLGINGLMNSSHSASVGEFIYSTSMVNLPCVTRIGTKRQSCRYTALR